MASIILQTFVAGGNSQNQKIELKQVAENQSAEFLATNPVYKPKSPIRRVFIPKTEFDTEIIKTYIREQAVKNGVNPETALFIAEKESQFDPTKIGDNGISAGLWQFNLQANPSISYKCAIDWVCSTQLAMKWIKEGKINAWSVWKYRSL